MVDAEKINISKMQCVVQYDLEINRHFDVCKNDNCVNLLLIGSCSCDRMYVSGESSEK